MTKLSIPIKYGLMITLGVVAWVIIAHLIIPNPQSLAHTFVGPIFFNVLQFAMIFLGLKAKEREYGRQTGFQERFENGRRDLFCLRTHRVAVFRCAGGIHRDAMDRQ